MIKKSNYKPLSAYQQLLLSPNWQKKRLEILSRDNWACRSCGNDKETLHVHHRIYNSGCKPWEYDNNLLVTLCSICHEEESNLSKIMPEMLFEFFMKTDLLPSDLYNIMNSDVDLNFSYAPEVVSSIIGFFLSNREAQLYVEKMFFNSLKEKS